MKRIGGEVAKHPDFRPKQAINQGSFESAHIEVGMQSFATRIGQVICL